jgi:L-threonylcarbamoyladenylate synthase
MKINIQKAKELLLDGKVVAIPTETVYGLAASAANPKAVASIFSLKGRPSHNPLILHVGSPDECLRYASVKPKGLEALLLAFWPGPLTVVIPVKQELILPAVRANLATAAFRMPKQSQTLELLQQISPLVAPSANLSGSPSATKPEHIEHDFGNTFPVLDGGACEHGVESTIVIFDEGVWQVARLGALSQETLAGTLGYLPPLAAINRDAPVCPGQLLAHYAPKARLVLSDTTFAECPKQLDTVIGFGDRSYPGAKRIFILAQTMNPAEAAHRLYDVLRELDRQNIDEAWVDMQFPDSGLWKTVKERLSRAANQ